MEGEGYEEKKGIYTIFFIYIHFDSFIREQPDICGHKIIYSDKQQKK